MTDPRDGHPHDPPPGGPDPREPVGSVGEEAARLLGALGGWAQEHAGGLDLGGAEPHPEGLAAGVPECTWCPVCRTVHLVRSASPEVRTHLATAATSFLQALTGLVASLPQHGGPSAAGADGFERIDLDGDDDE